MDRLQNIIRIDNVDKTHAIESIRPCGAKYIIKFHSGDKEYTYSRERVLWLTNPQTLDPSICRFYVGGKRKKKVEAVALFSYGSKKYFVIQYANGFFRQYEENEVEIRKSCLSGRGRAVFDYLELCAGVNKLGVDEEDELSAGILSSIYDRIEFIDEETAAAPYLNCGYSVKKRKAEIPIFPFGCNASQQKAVKAALSNQISVIQGPPGTGKTQTILNIIANLLVAGKSVLVVSNNNSATVNILEKLEKNGFGFLVAPLGKKENRELFILNQPPLNPDLPIWKLSSVDVYQLIGETRRLLERVEKVFAMQERLAAVRQEIADVELEQKHFEGDNAPESKIISASLSSAEIIVMMDRLSSFVALYATDDLSLVGQVKKFIFKYFLGRKLRKSGIPYDDFSEKSISEVLLHLQRRYYQVRLQELSAEKAWLERDMAQMDAKFLTKELSDKSLKVLKASLAEKYCEARKPVASLKDMYFGGKEFLENYPVVLSTTFSAKNCFSSETIFDYVIMDEASQISVDTGLLALTCARNAVIVGDTMQLPNVVTEEDAAQLRAVRKIANVPDSYDAVGHSFLSSVMATLPGVRQILLREHYRCHPDIINFCNQKFYGGNLLIMTERRDNSQHLRALMTAEGQHCRGHYNQREIDAVKLELLPSLGNIEDAGIIAPYNRQVQQFQSQLPQLEAATVHKYQGREKGTIVLSVTDDVISEFADNANLLNVAVSRAKDKFCLVVTGNPQELKGNIHDLLGYINYSQGAVVKSKLHSIYDYLFTQINNHRPSDIISAYNSENLTFALIEKIRTSYPHLSHIKALCHYPLRCLINDHTGLSPREVKYASHPATHLDFLIINRVSKIPLLAIETDGYSYHNENTVQYERDRIKDHILELYGLPLLRLSTVGHSEERLIVEALS